MASLPSLVGFLLLGALLVSSTAQNMTPGMEAGEFLGLSEVMGALLDNPNWTQMHPHPCTQTPWPGIQCDVIHHGHDSLPILHVTKLHIGPDVANPPVCKTTAYLSASLLKLPHLNSLSIVGCFRMSRVFLPAPIFGSFSSLEQLVVKSNPGLYGEIPLTLADTTTLRVLSLSQNSLHGQVPKGLGRLRKLEQLDLSYNNLTGKIPQEIGGLKSLTILDMSYNGLQGRLPYSLGQLQTLQKIDLSHNRPVGRIPSVIGRLKQLVFLDLSHNNLTGPIPDTLSGLKGLEYLLVENNPLNTKLPWFMGTLVNPTVLSLSTCGLVGTIPPSFCWLDQLIVLYLDRNNLHGTVPPKLGALPNLCQLNLSQNQLSGELYFSSEFVQRLGKKLDASGNDGLCTGHQFNEQVSQYLGIPPCADQTAKSSNTSHHENSNPYWTDASNAIIKEPMLLYLIWCNLIGFL